VGVRRRRSLIAALVLVVAVVVLLRGWSADGRARAGERAVSVPHYPNQHAAASLTNLIGGHLVLGTAGGRTCVWLGTPTGTAALVWPQGVRVFASDAGVRVVRRWRTVVRPGELMSFSGDAGDGPVRSSDPCLDGRTVLTVDTID
jgi:hypothetical protein